MEHTDGATPEAPPAQEPSPDGPNVSGALDQDHPLATSPSETEPASKVAANGDSEADTTKTRSSLDQKPSPFERSLKTTDVIIAIFTIVSGLSAAVSATVAVYLAGQLSSSSKQTDRAIGKIAELGQATQDQANAVKREIDLITRQANAARDSAASARQQLGVMEENSRAFMIPENMEFLDKLAVGQNARFRVYYRNIGDRAADDFYVTSIVYNRPDARISKDYPIFLNENKACDITGKEYGREMVFPDKTASSVSINESYVPGHLIDQSLLSGHSNLILSGCLHYRAGREIHTSAFCFVAVRDGIAASQTQTIHCGDGFYSK